MSCLLDVVRKLALSSDVDVARAMVENIPKVMKHLEKGRAENEILDIALALIFDKSKEDITILGVQLAKSIAKDIGAENVEKHFYREMWEMSAENSIGLAKAMIELLAESFNLRNSESLKAKLISIYIKYCESENWNIRKHCIGFFHNILQHSNKDMQDLLLPIYCKFLDDKSKWVKEKAINNCSLIIIYSHIQIPKSVMKNYWLTTESGMYTVSYYFSAVLLTLGPQVWEDMKKLLLRIVIGENRNKICLIQSIHEIAKMLGAEISGKELVEVYDTFLGDPALKIEAYSNLPNFLRELFPEDRDKYKTIIKSMSRDPSNWRCRFAFAHNICEYIGVYDYNHLYTDIWPSALELCEDQNCKIRSQAAKEVAKLAMYLLSKNIDWKRYIEMSIKKYSKGNLENRIVFLKIVKNLMGTEFAKDFNSEIEALTKDEVVNVRIMCAETVNYNKDGLWENFKKIMEEDKEQDVTFRFGKILEFQNKRQFITPPMIRNSHNEDVGGIIRLSHSMPIRSEKITSYFDMNSITK